MFISNYIDRAIGCLVGAAYGDSLGAAVEFMALDRIRQQYGERGITRLGPAFGHPAGVITDDTQMAIATALGIINTPREVLSDDGVVLENIWREYQAWYSSQSKPGEARGPGSTCMSALRSGKMGTIGAPLNLSAGCGAIMRAHPIGIAFMNNPDRAFKLGEESGAITHGHPNAYVPSGALAMLIAHLLSGVSFERALSFVLTKINQLPAEDQFGTNRALNSALETPILGDTGAIIDAQVGQIAPHGGGWHGHDALAIAIYAVRCALNDPLKAVEIAVNHSGDSDSTGSIAGAITGAMHGPEFFERALRDQDVTLEHHESLVELGQELVEIGGGGSAQTS